MQYKSPNVSEQYTNTGIWDILCKASIYKKLKSNDRTGLQKVQRIYFYQQTVVEVHVLFLSSITSFVYKNKGYNSLHLIRLETYNLEKKAFFLVT